MADITVGLPAVGTVAYFAFKDPFSKRIVADLGLEDKYIKLEVESIVSMVDYSTKFKRDPFMDVYNPVGINEIDYKLDKNDAVPIITFVYVDKWNARHLFKVPLTYVHDMSDPSSIPYENRVLTINLGMLPADLDIEFIYSDVSDFIATRLGVKPDVNDVTLGEVELISADEYETRETIRSNTVSVRETLLVRATKAENKLKSIIDKLKEKGISLS